MCFSATASFVAGGALSAGGVLTLSKTRTKREVPFAGIPLLFGIQQAIEGIVWLSFGSPLLKTIATYAFSMFSHVLWPIFVPIAILLLEKDPVRKKILRVFVGIGSAVGIYLFYFILADGITAEIMNGSISYDAPHLYISFVLMLYVFATCVSSFISSQRIINIFGSVMLTSFLIAGWFFAETLISVWCFFAAVLSIIIYWYFYDHYRNYPKFMAHQIH